MKKHVDVRNFFKTGLAACAMCFAVGPFAVQSAEARTRIVEGPSVRDPRIANIIARLDRANGPAARIPARINTNTSNRINVEAYVKSILSQFMVDLGWQLTDNAQSNEFVVAIESFAMPADRATGNKRVMVSASVSDERINRIVLRSSITIECGPDEGFGERDCPYDPGVINEVLYRLAP